MSAGAARMGRGRVGRVLSASRCIAVVAEAGTLLASVALLVYGTLVVIDVAVDTAREGDVSAKTAKALSIEFLQLVDLFLLGTVLDFIAIGLYELFIDDTLETPSWLHSVTPDDLKEKLVSVIVVLLGVTFLGSAVSGDRGRDLLYDGVAIAAVLLPLVALQVCSGKGQRSNER